MVATRFTVDPNMQVLLRDLEISQRRVLRRAGLPADLFARGPAALGADDYYRLWDAIETESGDPDLAVTIGQAISVEIFTPPLFAALCSPNLGVAAERIAAYKPLVGPLVLDLTQQPDGLTISCTWPIGPPPPQTLITIELIFWVALARIATRHEVCATAATSPQPPPTSSAAAYLGCQIVPGASASITFTGVDAGRPFLTENEQMWRFFAPELRRRLADLDHAATTAERVQSALLETLPAGDSTMAAVTEHLAVSQRTLQRQLQQEGTSYQAVLTETREQLARHYLTHSRMTTPEIAYLLGYDDSNSFYRAFRTWTDTTPETLRATAMPTG